MSNREIIITTALRLFNASGTKAVSTNHISDAAQVSPGNLYYHFDDKEAIIRSVHQRMVADWDAIWDDATPRGTVDDLIDVVRRTFVLEWRYRFFYRELRAILQRDEGLARTYPPHVRARMQDLETFFRRFVDNQVMRDVEPDVLRSLLTTCWIVANHWIGHLEELGEPVDVEHLLQGERQLLHILSPYLEAPPDLASRTVDDRVRRAYADLLAHDP